MSRFVFSEDVKKNELLDQAKIYASCVQNESILKLHLSKQSVVGWKYTYSPSYSLIEAPLKKKVKQREAASSYYFECHLRSLDILITVSASKHHHFNIEVIIYRI